MGRTAGEVKIEYRSACLHGREAQDLALYLLLLRSRSSCMVLRFLERSSLSECSTLTMQKSCRDV